MRQKPWSVIKIRSERPVNVVNPIDSLILRPYSRSIHLKMRCKTGNVSPNPREGGSRAPSVATTYHHKMWIRCGQKGMWLWGKLSRHILNKRRYYARGGGDPRHWSGRVLGKTLRPPFFKACLLWRSLGEGLGIPGY